MIVVAIENFDILLNQAFPTPSDRSQLRRFLSECRSVMLLGSTLRADLDQVYEERLFHSFSHLRLKPWSEEECMEYFRKRCARDGRELSGASESKVRALQHFTGGSPRMAVVLADLLDKGDPLSAAEMLNSVVDELTPYYQDLSDRIPPKSRMLFDALLRGGEPCSQSDLATRVGTTQNRIAQQFSWLSERDYVIGDRHPGSRALHYRAVDRIFVQFYRTRFLHHERVITPLGAMAELLEALFTARENWDWAFTMRDRGDRESATFFTRMAMRGDQPTGKAGYPKGQTKALSQYRSAKTISDAYDLARKAFLIAEVNGSKTEQLWWQGQVGWNLARLGRHDEALSAHLEAISLAREIDDKASEAWNQARVGWNLARLGRHEEALEAHLGAINLARAANDKAEEVWNQGQVGRNLSELGRHDEALSAHLEAISFAREIDDKASEAWYEGLVGWSQKKLGC
jgi:tetratricopeptide (TPR) repeat protein